MSAAPLFDVFGVSLKGPRVERLMAENLTEENADAYVMMAVVRRGVEDEFFIKREHPAEPA